MRVFGHVKTSEMGFVLNTPDLVTRGRRRGRVCVAVEGEGDTSGNGTSRPPKSGTYRTSDVESSYSHRRQLLAVPVTSSGFGPKVSVEDLNGSLFTSDDPLWSLIQYEAQVGAANEPFLATELYGSVLQYPSLTDAVCVVLANKLGTGYMQATQWGELLQDAYSQDAHIRRCMRMDLMAVMERDPSRRHGVGVLLYAKGWHALQCYRLAHFLWNSGKVHMALYLQSMISQRFGLDIHPAARIGGGVYFDEGTGIVIGETAVVGENVSMFHNVTLGGTGKDSGDRHPKVDDGVLIGAGSYILGNIRIGRGAQVNCRSVITKNVEEFTVVAGVPGKAIGKLPPYVGPYPSKIMNHALMMELTNTESDVGEGVGI
uniref:serine O-acetyltransferase n=1 Tax=Rhodosorus marinus TaxID=101924 RepID=A0A7S3E6V6_9RHOD|mmetsp:Transcript_12824/g.51379  ORF Transcript_12824/g.51379 Transcript_12824/m.51379 type:complete len:372 (+) Transcript_12824:143-1258(+)